MEKFRFVDKKFIINKNTFDVNDVELIEVKSGVINGKTRFYLTVNTADCSLDCFASSIKYKVLDRFLQIIYLLKNAKEDFVLVNEKLINKKTLTGIKTIKQEGLEHLTIYFGNKSYEIYSGYNQNLVKKICVQCKNILNKNKSLTDEIKELV